MSDNKRTGRGGKGYYIALILCAAAIWITGYVFYRNTQTREVSLEETYEDVLAGTLGTEDVAVIATQPPAQATAPAAPKATTPAPTEKPVLKTMYPLSGNEIYGYSMEALSYNQTTRDWRVHNGIDLAAEPGSEVCAAADGEVYTVYEDDAMGHTVVIRHSDGYTTRYCSLTEDIPVKPGDAVTMGQTIGYTGDSAIVESTLGSHLHFSVTRHDEPMDPMEFFALGQ
ncbi:MAG: M23 family metallopeptidase [Oscillospiraceae bacterium]|nr:M23 family metallopeptidase [Oscillospiraceae bacterium]MBQ7129449.1 M23 family metallopeptidase [Oscillospiraceae bacterium]